MKPQSLLAPGARRWSGVLLLTIAIAVGAVAIGIAGGGGTGAPAQRGTISTEKLSAFRTAVVQRLHAEHLDYHWVVCVRTSHRFAGVGVVRCNVDFGEPHIVAYCSMLRRGRLLTSQQDSAIPCGHDNSGYSAPVVQYG